MTELQDPAALIRAGTPLIVIEAPGERRVVDLFRQSPLRAWRALHRRSITEGLRGIDLDSGALQSGSTQTPSPAAQRTATP